MNKINSNLRSGDETESGEEHFNVFHFEFAHTSGPIIIALWIFLSARLLIPSESEKTFIDVSMKKWFLPVFFGVASFLFVCICLFLRRETDEVTLNQQDLAQRQLLSNPLLTV